MNTPREFEFINTEPGPSPNSVDVQSPEVRDRAVQELSSSIQLLESEYELIESEATKLGDYTKEHVQRIGEIVQQLSLLKGIQSKLKDYKDISD